MTTFCQTCKQDHALFYWVETSGKRVVSYICNHVTRLSAKTGRVSAGTGRIAHTDQALKLPIEERWSAGYAKKQQQQKELQFILMSK
jgi:hypothetical protein